MAIKISSHAIGVTVLLWTVLFTASAFATSKVELPLPFGCTRADQRASRDTLNKQLKPVFPPIPLQLRTPVEPTVFASNGRNYLIYELDLQNYADTSMTLRGIDVIDASNATEKRVAELKEVQLNMVLRPTGVDYWQYHGHPHVDANRNLGAGKSAVAFLCLAFESNALVPHQLRHRVHLDNESTEGPVIAVHSASLPIVGPPLTGTDWVPRNGPHLDSHHRMGLVVFDGIAQNARRFAIDWRKFKNGGQYSGDARDVHSYYAYGEKVLSVAEGLVVVATDGHPNNIPKTEDSFETAEPMTTENLGGNSIVIALSNGQFAEYYHLQPDSVRVKRGDRVQAGQVIARVGNSGDSRWPHLHFQVTNKPSMLASEGLPFVIDHFRVKVDNKEWMTRTREFPWGDEAVIDFGSETTGAKR